MTSPIHQHIERSSENNAALLSKLQGSLETHFGIHYFCYQKVTHSGEWHIASTNAEWLHYSAEQQFYRYDPSLIAPQYYQQGIVLPDMHQNSLFQETLMRHALEKFNFAHSLVLVEPVSDGCEYYIFSAPKEHARAYTLYLQQMNNIRMFARYFKDNTRQLQQCMQDNPIDLLALKGDDFVADHNVMIVNDMNQCNLDLLHELHQTYGLPQLTPRQQDCIIYLLQGKTAKETGQHAF